MKQHAVKALQAVGYNVWVNNVGRKGGVRFGKKGLPDIIGYSKEGKFVGVECKNLNTRDALTDEQDAFLWNLYRAGGRAGVVFLKGDVVTWEWRGGKQY